MAVHGGEQPLLSPPPPPPPPLYHPHPQPYILLPPHPRRRRNRNRHCGLSLSFSLLLLSAVAAAAAVFFLWPSKPSVHVVRLHLDDIHVSTNPGVSLDIALRLKIRVRNPNFLSFDYQSVVVSIAYRGRRLGSVTSDGGHVNGRGISYIDADLKLDGIQILHDVFHLIKDLVKGSIPFDTVTEIDGKLPVLLVDIPIQGKISCAVNVNPSNHTITHQDCYPEVSTLYPE